ncbi:MAG: DUF58 domain-containing protein [Suipraeoptans sp.]
MKKLIIYILVLLFSLYSLIMFEEGYFYMVFIIGLLFGLTLLIESLYIHRHISANISAMLIPVSQDNEIPIEIKVDNNSALPVSNVRMFLNYTNLLTLENENHVCICNLDEKQSSYVSSTYHSSNCGIIKVSLSKIKISDFLGIFSLSVRVNHTHEIEVLPKMHPIDMPDKPTSKPVSLGSDIYYENAPGTQPPELFGMREYIPGDRLQQINWKISAKKDTTLVKVFALPIDFVIAMYPDFSKVLTSKKDFYKRGRLLEFYVSLSFALLESELYHYLIWFNESAELIRYEIASENDLYAIMPQMLRMSYADANGNIAEQYITNYSYDNTITFLSLNTDLELRMDNDLIATLDSGDGNE